MKKLMISTIILLPLLILAIMLVSGAIMSMVTHIYVESVEFVEKGELILIMDDEANPPSQTAEVNIFPLKADKRDVVFASGDENVVSVDETGKVSANYYGETYITVTSTENVAATARRKVLVTDKHVHSLAISNKAEAPADMYTDETFSLAVEILPKEAENQLVHWQSSNPDVLNVSDNGVLLCKGYSATPVTVTATADDNAEITDSIQIRCHSPLAGISVVKPSDVIARGEEDFPEITFLPNADSDYKVTYSTSNENVATVDENGHITVTGAGVVDITATATDGRNNSKSATVSYTFTDGYFMGALFDNAREQFDYDQYQGKQLPIQLKHSPDGSYRQIIDVTFDRDGLITFDSQTEKFSLTGNYTDDLGSVKIKIKAKKYDNKTNTLQEFQEDECVVTITRKTTNLFFDNALLQGISSFDTDQSTIGITETKQQVKSGVGVRVEPSNHTDTLVFALQDDGGVATFDATQQTLHFTGAGTAVVRVSVQGADLHKDLTINYQPPKAHALPNEPVDPDTQGKELNLSFYQEDNKSSVKLDITDPEGYTHEVQLEEDNGVVQVDEQGNITPLKGGFATINVVFTPNTVMMFAARNSVPVQKIVSYTIYVDKPVAYEDIKFSPDNGFVTSKYTFGYSVTIDVNMDVLEGKKILVDGAEQTVATDRPTFSFAGLDFGGKDERTVTVSVVYTEQAKQCGITKDELVSRSLTVRTTKQTLTSGVKVQCGETTFATDNNQLYFDDLGAQLTLTVTLDNPQPSDFRFDEATKTADIKFNEHTFFAVDVAVAQGGTSATITLVSNGTGSLSTKLVVAGIEFGVNVKADTVAHSLEVSYNTTALSSGTTYSTFLGKLSLTVLLKRDDGKAITNTKLKYTFGGKVTELDENKVSYTIVLDLSGATEATTFGAESGKATGFAITLNKLLPQNLEYYLTYRNDGGLDVELDRFKLPDGNKTIINLAAATEKLTFHANFGSLKDVNLLGRFDKDMESCFAFTSANGNEGWTISFNADTGELTVTLPTSAKFLDTECTFSVNGQGKTFVFNRTNVAKITFTGFDSTDDTNGGDVYKGYQQVRVFAKQSYYSDRTSNKVVDYFAMPFAAYTSGTESGTSTANTALVRWTLTKWVGDKAAEGAEQYVVSQKGTTVTVNKGGATTTYTIVPAAGQDSTLQAEDGTAIAQGGKWLGDTQVPWVDVYAKTDEARIYFGEFVGLSESDVQNDYFGNFGEQASWTQVEDNEDNYDGSGRTFAASEGAYSYLNVTADDGVDGSDGEGSKVSVHYNFNVLQDKDVCNVFDAEGYYANSKVVLHENLYGPGEAQNADGSPDEKLVLNETTTGVDSTKLGKTTIYGNGYQINLEERHKAIPDTSYNNSANVRFGTLYNVIVKGCNPVKEVTMLKVRQYIILRGAYYCDIQYYTKLFSDYSTGTEPYNASTNKYGPSDLKKMYLKNTVLRNCSQQAVLVYADYTRSPLSNVDKLDLYLENIVETDCLLGFNAMGVAFLSKVFYYNIWIKGDFECLDYDNVNSYLEKSRNFVEFGVESTLRKNIKLVNNWMEWLGQTKDVANFANSFFNPVITGLANGVRVGVNCWDGEKYTQLYTSDLSTNYGAQNERYSNPTQKLANGLEIQRIASIDPTSGVGMTIYSYSDQSSKDSGVTGDTGDRDWKLLFTRDRYIRLLCQYKSADAEGNLVRNDDHLLWHMQKAYRDLSLIKGREEDHIKSLVDSLKGVTWTDGTGIDANGNIVVNNEIVVKYEDIIAPTQP